MKIKMMKMKAKMVITEWLLSKDDGDDEDVCVSVRTDAGESDPET